MNMLVAIRDSKIYKTINENNVLVVFIV